MTDHSTSRRMVSVVIDNYNYERFVGAAIESALAQTYDAIEVIVVDDGSTDGSRAIIDRYRSHVTAIHQENGGQGAAFNAGFAASSGEIILFLDADDLLAPEAVEKVVAAFDDPTVVKAHWRLSIVDGEGRSTGGYFPPEAMPDGSFLEHSIAEGPFYDSRNMPPTSGNAWARSFLERVLPMPAEEYDHGADVYLHSLAPVYGTMRAIPETLGCYRAHGGNHYWKNSLSDAKVTEYIGRFLSSCRLLATHLRRRGHPAPEAAWLERNFTFLWLTRLRAARDELARVVAPGRTLIAVTGGEWDADEHLPGRTVRALVERAGEDWGPPAGDEEALRELAQAVDTGADYLALWWTCWWWRDAYPRFIEALDTRFTRVVDDDALVVYDLRPVPGRTHS
jgi:hypothetical protein